MSLRLPLCFASLLASAFVGADAADPYDYGGRCGTQPPTERFSTGAPAARPAQGTFQSESAHFIVHYYDGADTAYATTIRAAAELAWRILIDTLAYDVPPSDGTQGGDARIDLYVRTPTEIGTVRGRTTGETQVGVPYPNSFTSYVEIVDTLGTALLETVTAHEVFHVVQFGYDAGESSSWLELLGTWIEDRAFDQHDVYYEVLPGFFDRPQKGLFSHVYSNVPFAFYLAANYGENVLREIMDECATTPGSNIRGALDAALSPYSTSFTDELQTFGQWNFFTGDRDDGGHYEEGSAWPQIAVEKRTDCYPMPKYDTMNKCDPWGANYFVLDGNGYTDSLRVWFLPEYFANSMMTAVRFDDATPGEIFRESFGPFTIDSFTVDNWRDCDSLLVVYHYTSSNPPVGSIRLSAYFPETTRPNADWVLVLDRDACIRPFDGSGDEFSPQDGEESPFREALVAAGAPYVLSSNLATDLTACRAVFVVGGYDDAGPTLTQTELTQLMSYMDGGGGVYLESRRLGEWMDPSLGAGSPTEQAFWSYFGVTFLPGDSMITGNVTGWSTHPPLGSFDFSYDTMEPPDNFVGALAPTTADTLVTDEAGNVRAAISYGANNSLRIHSTVLLGGSTSGGPGATREAYVSALLDLYGVAVPALSADRMRVARQGRRVTITGEIFGYNGEPLRMERSFETGRVNLAVSVDRLGDRASILAYDEPPPVVVTYRLHGGGRTLWTHTLNARPAPAPLAIAGITPNPSRDAVDLTVTIGNDALGEVAVYDVAGRRVHRSREALATGTNLITLSAPARLAAGVYFVRVSANGDGVTRKFVIVR